MQTISHRIRKILGFLTLMIAVVPSFAWGGVRISLVGIGDYTLFNPASAVGFPGGGMFFEFPLSPKLTLELDGLYFTRSFLSGGILYDGRHAEGALLFRFPMTHVISLAVGPYYERALGNIVDSTGNSYGYDYFALNPSSMGFMTSMRFNIILNRRFAFFADMRYGYSFMKASTDASVSGGYTDMQAIGGLQISFGKGNRGGGGGGGSGGGGGGDSPSFPTFHFK